MRILTYNLWHGLDPDSTLYFRALEPKLRRQKRKEQLFDLLSKIDVDVCFFQEICPLPELAGELEQILKMRAYLQGDLMGIRLFGFGAPVHLHSGLGVFVNEGWLAKPLFRLQLSGPKVSWAGIESSFQVGECRYALGVEVDHPKEGRILLVGLHLHHGFEFGEQAQAEISSWCKRHQASESLKIELIGRLRKGDERRRSELNRLFEKIKQLQSRYQKIIIGGDFNFDLTNYLQNTIISQGFEIVGSETQSKLFSWNPQTNASFRLRPPTKPSVFVDDLSFEPEVLRDLKQTIIRLDQTPRRLDQLWIKGDQGERFQVELLGQSEDLPPSDHYALFAHSLELS